MKKPLNAKKPYKKNYKKSITKKTTKPVVNELALLKGVTYINKEHKTYTFTRTNLNQQLSFTQVTGGVNVYQGFIFTFDPATLVPGWAEYTALFRRYKFTKVKYIFRVEDAVSPGGISPSLYLWKNDDPTLVVGTINVGYVEEIEHVTCLQMSEENRIVTKTCVPYVNIGGAGINLEMEPKKYSWLSTASSPFHYTIAGLLNNIPIATDGIMNIGYDIEYTIVFDGCK